MIRHTIGGQQFSNAELLPAILPYNVGGFIKTPRHTSDMTGEDMAAEGLKLFSALSREQQRTLEQYFDPNRDPHAEPTPLTRRLRWYERVCSAFQALVLDWRNSKYRYRQVL